MSSNLEAKKTLVAEIEEKIDKAESIVVVEYSGLTVEAVTALRAKCRAARCSYDMSPVRRLASGCPRDDP